MVTISISALYTRVMRIEISMIMVCFYSSSFKMSRSEFQRLWQKVKNKVYLAII